MKITIALTASLLSAALVASGCAASRGERQADTAPRLVERDKSVLWDRGDHFGPVPLSLASVAALRCASLDTKDQKWQAEGFHARAQDLQGRTLPGGGYYCKPRQRTS